MRRGGRTDLDGGGGREGVIVPTGDEIRPVGLDLSAPGEIVDTNSMMLAAQAKPKWNATRTSPRSSATIPV